MAKHAARLAVSALMATTTVLIGVHGIGSTGAAPPAAQVGVNGQSVIDVSPNGRFVLVQDFINGPDTQRIDLTNDTTIDLPDVPFGRVTMFDGGSKLLIDKLPSAVVRDISTGIETPLVPPTTDVVGDLVTYKTVSEDGQVFGIQVSNGSTLRNTVGLYVPSTGAVTLLGPLLPTQVGSSGNQSTQLTLSRDGRFAAFVSAAFNGGHNVLYVYDTVTATMTRVSKQLDGSNPLGFIREFDLSADGRHAVFVTESPNIVAGLTTAERRAYVTHLDTGTTVLVGTNAAATINMAIKNPISISSDGRAVGLFLNQQTLLGSSTMSLPQPAVVDVASGDVTALIDPPGSDLPNGEAIGGVLVFDDASKVSFSTRSDNFAPGDPGTPGITSRSFLAPLRSEVPSRFLDTRAGGRTFDGLFQGVGVVAGGTTLELTVAGRGGVPANAEAVALNLTATSSAGAGFATVFPCGSTRPTAASMTLIALQTVANMVVAQPGTAGKVCIYVSQTTQLIADLAHVFPDGSPLTPITARRLVDRRPGGSTIDGQFQGGGNIAANTELSVSIAGRATIPSGAEAAAVNLTVVNPGANGFVRLYPCGAPTTTSSTLNFIAGQTRASATITGLSATGQLCVRSNQPVTVILDANGYMPAGSTYSPLTPARLLDTRPSGATIDGQFQATGPIAGQTALALTVANRGGTGATPGNVVLNVAATAAAAPGFVVVYPCGTIRPTAATLTFAATTTTNNHTIVRVSSPQVCVYASQTTHVIIDVVGTTP